MERRTLKQILFGSGYLLFIFLIVAGIYFIWLKPEPSCFDSRKNQGETDVDCGGPCASCEIKTLFPLETAWSRYFSAGAKTILAAEIKNSNSNYGADNFFYTFDVYDSSDKKIHTLTKNSFIYTSEIKYLIEAGVNINPENINRIEFSLSDVNWKSKEEFSRPEIQSREIKTEDSRPVNVSGLVINNNAFDLSKINIIAFLFNKEGARISASKTELDNVKAFEERFFRIIFPSDISLVSEITQEPEPIYNFTRDLTIGSKGEDVRDFQEFLKKEGFFDREPTDYFGQITQNALIQYQKKAGISPASGYFGPKTQAYINALTLIPSPLLSPKFSATEADPSKTKIYVEAIQ